MRCERCGEMLFYANFGLPETPKCSCKSYTYWFEGYDSDDFDPIYAKSFEEAAEKAVEEFHNCDAPRDGSRTIVRLICGGEKKTFSVLAEYTIEYTAYEQE